MESGEDVQILEISDSSLMLTLNKNTDSAGSAIAGVRVCCKFELVVRLKRQTVASTLKKKSFAEKKTGLG